MDHQQRAVIATPHCRLDTTRNTKLTRPMTDRVTALTENMGRQAVDKTVKFQALELL